MASEKRRQTDELGGIWKVGSVLQVPAALRCCWLFCLSWGCWWRGTVVPFLRLFARFYVEGGFFISWM